MFLAVKVLESSGAGLCALRFPHQAPLRSVGGGWSLATARPGTSFTVMKRAVKTEEGKQ